MKLLSWNVQGIGTPLTKDHLQYLCQLYNPDIVFLAETKAPLSRMNLFFKKSKFHDWFIIPSVGIEKGIAIAWHNNIDMKLVSAKYNVCHFEASLDEKQVGNKTSSSSKTVIIQTIVSIGLQNAGYEGAPFTWSNNRKGEADICERIDRALTYGLKNSRTPRYTLV
ncbi:uncharacterized protein LOC113277661 [Papaver somniferum]|uniref:uncharacterized protein LOC113277661 n=1 Tax=Papaver somniferum TaxID=3469 RepID=UPI000E6F63F7|nr:uncharacterized protein LOC113277661 [Papaver somniferum]